MLGNNLIVIGMTCSFRIFTLHTCQGLACTTKRRGAPVDTLYNCMTLFRDACATNKCVMLCFVLVLVAVLVAPFTTAQEPEGKNGQGTACHCASFLMALQSTDEFDPLVSGSRCEALFQDDDLYYEGKVISYDPAKGLYRIEFDDGDVSNVPADAVMPYSRTVVFKSDEVIVLDGHILVDAQGSKERRSCRLLTFASSPQLYQSALVLHPDGSLNPEVLAFEITQVFCLAAVLLQHAQLRVGDRASGRGVAHVVPRRAGT